MVRVTHTTTSTSPVVSSHACQYSQLGTSPVPGVTELMIDAYVRVRGFDPSVCAMIALRSDRGVHGAYIVIV